MLKTVIPPPVYALGTGGIMWWLDHSWPLLSWPESVLNTTGLVIIALALLADVWSLGLFRRAGTSPNPMKPGAANKLVVRGLYCISRNPMYLGLLIVLFGWWLYLGSLSPLLMLPVFVQVLTVQQIVPEEKVLEEKFGAEYLAYKQQVRRWI
ncbi:MAG: isoprenylcysteine carboxyl methyltransferase [Thiothrix nivea]|nr:MAG: isoprenylcysteine carboxyl methyltransferase [Thiothrix nivea]